MEPITSLPARELARRIAAGDLSPVAVVEAHIARIEAVNPTINAVVTPLFERARREAAAAEGGPPRGPLHGVPVTVKECFDVAGARATCGLAARAEHYAEADAAAVARLRAAGAIVLGLTATPDNCWAQETATLLFGRTSNPWDVSRTVAGSSGGEAAIIAAGGSPLGIGSDIAGSIRLPAAMTGVVGLRPTSGTVPEAGFWPESAGDLALLNGVGPLARRVADVALAFDVLRGAPPQPPPDPGAVAGRRFAAWADGGLLPASPAVRAGVAAAAAALSRAGMRQVAGAPRHHRYAVLGWQSFMGPVERAAVARGFGSGAAWSPAEELRRSLAGGARVSPGPLRSWLLTHYGSLLGGGLGLFDGRRWREEIRADLLELVGEDGVVVCPVFPTSAPRHGWTNGPTLLSLSYQVWVNMAGLPGLSLPVGRTGRGMPVGVQVVGGPGAEAAVLAAGAAIEAALMPRWRGPL